MRSRFLGDRESLGSRTGRRAGTRRRDYRLQRSAETDLPAAKPSPSAHAGWHANDGSHTLGSDYGIVAVHLAGATGVPARGATSGGVEAVGAREWRRRIRCELRSQAFWG